MRQSSKSSRFLSVLAAALWLVLVVVPASAQVPMNPSAPQTYRVRHGDTLWNIAGRFLRDPWRWSEIWEANRKIPNPNRIYPGDELTLSYVNGRPRVRSNRGGGTRYEGGMRVVKLSPRVRVESLENEVPMIPIGAVAPFMSRTYVAETNEIDKAPYVVGFPDEHIVAGLHDSIYVRSIRSARVDNFEVLRPGEPYKDPDTGEILGYEALYVANARLERTGDPAKLLVSSLEKEIAIGDRVIPAVNDTPLRNFFPEPAPAGLKGKIISVVNGVSQIGQFNTVVINRGKRDGLKVGSVLETFRGGFLRRDEVKTGAANWDWRSESPLDTEFWYGNFKFNRWIENEPDPNAPLPLHQGYRQQDTKFVAPFERSGILLVFRVFDRISLALVMRATNVIHVKDTVAAPRG